MSRRPGRAPAVWRWQVVGILLVEGLLYATFLTMDVLRIGLSTVPLKYAGVLSCVAFALWASVRGGDRLVLIALALTALADWYLLVRGDHYAVGVGVFLCVQAVYLLRLRRAGARTAWPLRAGVALAAGAGLFLLDMASPFNLLAGLYFSQLLSNTVLAWTLARRRRRRAHRLFAGGLVLFVGCDVCVGLSNVALLAPGPYRAVSIGMWLFYLPSQVLIALSALPEEEGCS